MMVGARGLRAGPGEGEGDDRPSGGGGCASSDIVGGATAIGVAVVCNYRRPNCLFEAGLLSVWLQRGCSYKPVNERREYAGWQCKVIFSLPRSWRRSTGLADVELGRSCVFERRSSCGRDLTLPELTNEEALIDYGNRMIVSTDCIVIQLLPPRKAAAANERMLNKNDHSPNSVYVIPWVRKEAMPKPGDEA